MVLTEPEPEKIINRLVRPFGRAVQQCQIQSAFGRHVARRKGLQIFHAAWDIAEGKFARLHSLAKGLHALDRFLVSPARRSFPQAHGPFAVAQLHDDHFGDVLAAAACDCPGVDQLQIHPPKAQFHTGNKTLNHPRNQLSCFQPHHSVTPSIHCSVSFPPPILASVSNPLQSGPASAGARSFRGSATRAPSG